MSLISKWVGANFKKEMPFSFIYDSTNSKEFTDPWVFAEESINLDRDPIKKIFTYKDPKTKLKIICEVLLYEDYSAVEWTLYFKNENNVDTPVIEDIYAIDIKFPSKGEYNILRISGNSSSATDFGPIVTPLSKGMNLVASCQGGRSSSGGFPPSEIGGVVPFFNLEETGEGKGIILGVGWTGQWSAKFEHDTEETLRVQAGMEITHLKLFPGEQIRTPKILILFWEGSDFQIGNNALRRFIVANKIPKINGKTVEIAIGGNNWFQKIGELEDFALPGFVGHNGFTEQNQIEFAHKCKELGIEYYWLDAGWSEGGWPFANGSWYLKKEGFPNGWKNLINTLEELKLKFILWFEPERVCPNSQLWREHPDWLLKIPKKIEEKKSRFDVTTKYLNILGEKEFGILNLGNIEARKWLTEHISKMITDLGINMFRHDINVDLLPSWQNADSKNRQGITEIRHIEGLYAFWDELLKRHTNLIIDCVSEGDRRIDLETISRSIRMWTSDYVNEPIGAQCATYGLNLFLPGHANGIDPKNQFSKYVFRSQLSGGAAICWDIMDKNFPEGLARKLINEVKLYRPLFYGDFWPLTPYTLSVRDWIAWQFDRPDMGKGLVFAFRRSDMAKKEIKLLLKGIKKEQKYELHVIDKDIKEIFTGKKLIEEGLIIEEHKAPESILIGYEIVKQ